MEKEYASKDLYLDKSYLWCNLIVQKLHCLGWKRSIYFI